MKSVIDYDKYIKGFEVVKEREFSSYFDSNPKIKQLYSFVNEFARLEDSNGYKYITEDMKL